MYIVTYLLCNIHHLPILNQRSNRCDLAVRYIENTRLVYKKSCLLFYNFTMAVLKACIRCYEGEQCEQKMATTTIIHPIFTIAAKY